MRRLFPFAALLILLALSAANAATSPKPENDGSVPAQTDAEGGRISVNAKADTTTPYQNQPVLYTVRVVVREGVSKMSASAIDITNAIVEETGSPDVFDAVEHGRPVRVAEFRYIITPLQAGKMIIPAVALEGEFQAPSLDPSGGSAVSSATQQALNFFSTYGAESFHIASNATVLNVKPPVAAMDPWLPLTSLKISEKIDASQSVHVGEPVTRKITLSATGAVGSQLPDTGAQQQFGNVRAYADKPVMGENFDNKTAVISGWRTDSYTVIARSAGPLVLPAIRISWWDVVNNRAAIAQLPERVVYILPAKTAPGPTVDGDHAHNQQPAGKSQQKQVHWLQNAFADIGLALSYAGVSLVIAVLLFAVFRWGEPKRRLLRFKEAALASMRAGPRNAASGISPGATLKDVRTAEELKIFLQSYAHRQWSTRKNASLETIFSLSPDSPTKLEDDVEALIQGIGAALYAGGTADMDDLKKRSRRVIKALGARARSGRENREGLSVLNPS
jgi:hypothetical protein